MSDRNGQFFPRLEAVLKEYGEAMHYTDLAKLVEIPEKNVCTALAHHTRQHPLGTIRRIKRGTYLYVGTPRARLAKVKEAEAAAEALPRRVEPLPVDQPPLFKGAVTPEEIDAKTHPAQRMHFVPEESIPRQLNTFGDSLSPQERAMFRQAANLAAAGGWAAPATPYTELDVPEFSVDRDGIKFPPPLRAGLTMGEGQVVHVTRESEGDEIIFFTWRGKMWRGYSL